VVNNKTDSATIDDLATRIASLDADQQAHLLEKVAEINFRKGLKSLSKQYRARLQHESKLEASSESILTELAQLREQIASDDYRL
jgi:hypothetical protein